MRKQKSPILKVKDCKECREYETFDGNPFCKLKGEYPTSHSTDLKPCSGGKPKHK